MTRIDRLTNQIEIDRKVLAESDGATREAVREHLIDTLDTLYMMSASEMMEEVE